MKKGKLGTGLFAVALLLMVAVSSCKDETCNGVETCPELGVIERTDLEITGEFTYSDFQENIESDKTTDIVTYDFFGSPSARINFNIWLSSGHLLKIELYNAHNINPWEHANIEYDIYPTQELDDKWKFVKAQYIIDTETVAYLTNPGVNFPPGYILDAFMITGYDGIEINCRIRDMVLYKSIDPSKTIEINGTFTGSVTFLD